MARMDETRPDAWLAGRRQRLPGHGFLRPGRDEALSSPRRCAFLRNEFLAVRDHLLEADDSALLSVWVDHAGELGRQFGWWEQGHRGTIILLTPGFWRPKPYSGRSWLARRPRHVLVSDLRGVSDRLHVLGLSWTYRLRFGRR